MSAKDHLHHHRLAERFRQSGELDKAAYNYRRAAELAPSAATLVNFGNILMEQGRLADACDAFEAALGFDGSMQAAQFGLGCALLAMGQPAGVTFARSPAFADAQRGVLRRALEENWGAPTKWHAQRRRLCASMRAIR